MARLLLNSVCSLTNPAAQRAAPVWFRYPYIIIPPSRGSALHVSWQGPFPYEPLVNGRNALMTYSSGEHRSLACALARITKARHYGEQNHEKGSPLGVPIVPIGPLKTTFESQSQPMARSLERNCPYG
jgi:hypothetical protein